MRSAILVTISVAAPIAALLALSRLGLGFEGNPFAVLVDGPERLWAVGERRGPVVAFSFLAWLAALCLVVAAAPRRWRPDAARLFALALAYLPLLLLAGAALQPGLAAERLLVVLGGPALAVLTLAACGALGPGGAPGSGLRALAVACGASVLASAADVVAGSPLTQLSLAGPNPAGGHRLYGIGNELEAVLIVQILVGTAAALRAFAAVYGGKRAQRDGAAARRGAVAFVAVAAVLAFVFAYGRFGADVGAAIALPLGGVVAAAVLLGRRRLALFALLAPLPALALLAAADLLTGADAHLTRSVLRAEGGGDVLAVLADRLSQAGESFARPLLLAGLPLLLAGAALAWLRRERIDAWLRPWPPLRAGFAGATAAILVATVANDSGALLLELGAIYIAAFLALAWAEGRRFASHPSATLDGSCESPSSRHIPGATGAV